MSVESDIAELKAAVASLSSGRSSTDSAEIAALRATVQSLESRLQTAEYEANQALNLHDDFPDDLTGGAGGSWDGKIRIAGKVVTSGYLTSFTGTPSGFAAIYFDAVTPPAYVLQTAYDAADWGDEYKIVRLGELYAAIGSYNVDRA